ncbi:hypothetical protein BG011_008148 [Mortierella polycephala]|uniref:Uncharacterized protein n=1 Tax=Mortierella polycephala TaxID=41804 RepID=A0A9P6TWW4_9FUNG|nr:hypothetical protein BG011_008148 [Mortierella polycephala]
MSSGKQKRGSAARTKSRNSPPSSPSMPPAPLQAKNRGAASPHHYTTELAPSLSSSALPSTHTGPELRPVGLQSDKGSSLVDDNLDADLASAPPALADGVEVVHVTMLTPKQQTRWFRRWMARVALLYLGYVILFVCPNTSDSKANPVCNGVMRVQNWLRPYSKPVTERFDETYRTYAEPYMDQYGRPLYQQSQKYYHQYAHPHVNKAFTAVYPDNVKAQVDRAHTTHVQPVIDKVSSHVNVAWDRASLEAHRVFDPVVVFYMTHINPFAHHPWTVIQDAAKTAKGSLAKQTDEIWGTHYSEHGPSKESRARRRAAEKKAKELKNQAKHTKEDAEARTEDIKHQAKHAKEDAEARTEDIKYQAKRAKEDAEARAEDIKYQAKRTKEDAEAHVDSIKDTLLKKATGAQKMAGEYAANAQKKAEEYSNTIKIAMAGTAGEVKKKAEEQQVKVPKATEEAKKTAAEKGRSAQHMAEEFVETVSESIKSNAHEAQRAVGEEAEYLKKMADEKAYEAGKLSEQIKMSIIEKAHKAKEALARQAENIRHSAYDQVEWVQEAGTHLKDRVVGSSYEAKESVQQGAEDLSKTVREKKEKMERLTEQEAAALKAAAIEKEREALKMADKSKHKAQKAFDASGREAEGMKDKVVKSVKDAEKAAEEYTEGVMKSARDYAKGAKDKAHEETINIQNSADQIVMEGKDQAKKAKDNVAQQVKEASETVKHKTHDAHTASEVTLAAMLAGIENTFGQFRSYEDVETKNLWNQLQDAINEHIAGAKMAAYDLEAANREAYEAFESYVRDWKHQDDSLEGRLSKLKQQSAESTKKIGTKTEESQRAAKSRVKALSADVEVYLSGLKGFLADRLAALKEPVVSEMSVFKDTSSKSDEKTARAKFAELEEMARNKLEESGKDAQMKAQKLLNQVDEIWAESEAESQEYVRRTRELTQQAIEEANRMSNKSKLKAQSVKNKVGEKVHDMLPKESSEEADPNVQVADEEPGSGHRHHRL